MLDYLKKGFTFVAKKNSKIFYKSKRKGIFPLFFCIKKYKKQMENAEVLDKIVGIGAARLLVYGKIKRLYALTITYEAIKLLEKNKMKIIYKKITKKILNQYKTDICPVEAMSKKYRKFGDFLRKLEIFLK